MKGKPVDLMIRIRHIMILAACVAVLGGLIFFPQGAFATVYKDYLVRRADGLDVLCDAYVVRSGDQVMELFRLRGKIAPRRFPEFFRLFKRLNPHIRDPDRIYPGQRLLVPLRKYPLGTLPKTDSGVIRIPYLSITDRGSVEVQPSLEPARAYQVQSGDSLSKILSSRYGEIHSESYNLALAHFKRLNPMVDNINRIYAGETLNLPLAENLAAALAAGETPVEAAPVPEKAPPPELAEMTPVPAEAVDLDPAFFMAPLAAADPQPLEPMGSFEPIPVEDAFPGVPTPGPAPFPADPIEPLAMADSPVPLPAPETPRALPSPVSPLAGSSLLSPGPLGAIVTPSSATGLPAPLVLPEAAPMPRPTPPPLVLPGFGAKSNMTDSPQPVPETPEPLSVEALLSAMDQIPASDTPEPEVATEAPLPEPPVSMEPPEPADAVDAPGAMVEPPDFESAPKPPEPKPEPPKKRPRLAPAVMPLENVLKKFGASLIADGMYFFPSSEHGEITLNLSENPVVTLPDKSRVILGIQGEELSIAEKDIILGFWKNARTAVVVKDASPREILEAVLGENTPDEIRDGIRFSEAGVSISVQADAIYPTPENDAFIAVTWLADSNEKTVASVKEYLEKRGILILDILPDQTPALTDEALDQAAPAPMGLTVDSGNHKAMAAALLMALDIQYAQNVPITFPYSGFSVTTTSNLAKTPAGREFIVDFGKLHGQSAEALNRAGLSVVSLQTGISWAAMLMELAKGLSMEFSRDPEFAGAQREREKSVSFTVPGMLLTRQGRPDLLFTQAQIPAKLKNHLWNKNIKVIHINFQDKKS